MRRPGPQHLATVVALLLAAVEAEARVGGGQRHGGGGGGYGGGGGFGGGGGGGGDGGEVVWLLLQLVLRYPQVGVPTLIVVAVVVLVQSRRMAGPIRQREVYESRPHAAPRHRSSGLGARRGWAALADDDPGLSEPVFQDLVQLVFRRAYEAVATGAWDPLAPYVADHAREGLAAGNAGVREVHELVIAASPVVAVRRVGRSDEVDVAFTSSRDEVGPQGARRVHVDETWTFRRAVGARSLSPEAVQRLACPSCGAAVQTDAMGRCANCGTPITAGQLQWQAAEVRVGARRAFTAPDVGWSEGGEEPSYHEPTVVDPALPAQLRAFAGRHPDFDREAFAARVEHVFLSLQAAWDALKWEDARPFCTDAAWNQLGFFVDRYRRAGLRNRLADVRLIRTQSVKVTVDPWYEAVTLRVWGAMRDWTEDASGRVLGGNRDVDRWFSEYWTFLRAIGSGVHSGDPARCPSCGAPLDKVNAAGVCGYCDSVITTGRYDWVLSRIDQAEDYRG